MPAEVRGTAGLALHSPKAFLQSSGPFSLRHPNDLFIFRIRDKKDSGQKLVGTEMKVSSGLVAFSKIRLLSSADCPSHAE